MFKQLMSIDELDVKEYKSKPVYIHKDHRFELLLIHKAQADGLLPKPCTFVMFDGHHDLASPSDDVIKELNKMRRAAVDDNKLIDLVTNKLRRDDADWIKASMELGLIDNVVIFGIRQDSDDPNPFTYNDSCGLKHTVYHQGSFPTGLLKYQGDLADHARRYKLQELWDILGWDTSKSIYYFKENQPKIVFDMDLDTFVMIYDEFTFPWNQEVYDERIQKESDYFTTKGWSGKQFMQGLAEKAGILTIATEPDYCGGMVKMKQILKDVNKFIFDNQIK